MLTEAHMSQTWEESDAHQTPTTVPKGGGFKCSAADLTWTTAGALLISIREEFKIREGLMLSPASGESFGGEFV